ncbi:MAG: hypothetical protein ACQEXJ_16985 [Myxococcota bacterium]
MNGRSATAPMLEMRRDPCAGRIWSVHLAPRGEPDCAFCAVRARRFSPGRPATAPAPDLEPEAGRDMLAEALHRHRRRDVRWVLLSPDADPFAPGSPDLAAPALALAEDLLRRDIGVVVRTRGGVAEAGGLEALARRHADRLRVEPGFFSVDPEQVATWERGTAPLSSRLALAGRLASAGADVEVRVGPIVPLVNDGERDLQRLLREVGARGVRSARPTWVREAPGLLRQVEREVSRSRARMLHGWFHMEPGRPGRPAGLAPRVRRHVLERLRSAAAATPVEIETCRCVRSRDGGSCATPPAGITRRRQLDLFAGAG